MPIPQMQPLLSVLALSRSRFLYGLERIPDDRLEWSPAGTVATPLQLAGKAAAALGFMAHVIRERTLPKRPDSPPSAPRSRDEAAAALEAAFEQLRSVVEGLAVEDLDALVPAPWRRPAPVLHVAWWLPGIVGYLQGQLNYLQSVYGDTDPNIPPEWGEAEA